MTNKPMLSVERKVIEDILADARVPGHDYMAARKVLRALLDKPAAQQQGEPVAKYVETVPKFKFETLVEHCKRLERQLYELRAECNDMALYKENAVWFWQHDGADYLQSLSCPVVIPASQLRELLEGKAQHNPIAEQPAPVAVVMPELKTPYYKVVPTKFGNKEGFWQITPDSSIVYDNRDEAQARADARNASRAQHFFDSLKPCLEEVARLNGVKP